MISRDYEPKDYPVIKGWWEDHSGSAPAEELLSEDGLIIENNCAGWIYTGNSPIAFMGWMVGNPHVDGRLVYHALEQLTFDLKAIAKARGSEVVFVYTNQPGLLKLYEKLGFEIGDESVTNMISGV